MEATKDKHTKQGQDFKVGIDRDLSIGELSALGLTSWERGEVFPLIFDWARDAEDNIVPDRARRAFLIWDADNATTQNGYRFPIALPNSDGELIVTREGVNAANSRLGALINNPEDTDMPLEVLQRARTALNGYREQLQETDKATKDLDQAITEGNYRSEGTEEKNCTNCDFDEDGHCERFDFEHGGSEFISDAWQPIEASDDFGDDIRSKSKIQIIKQIAHDWIDSVLGNHKPVAEAIKAGTEQTEDDTPQDDKTIIATSEDRDSPTLSIMKTKAGRYAFIGRYSNNFRDNDIVPEIITRKAHKDYAERVSKGLAELPELWLMHNEAWKVGKATHVVWDENDKGQGFAIMLGLFDRDKQYIAESLIKSGMSHAMSHGFGRNPVKRDHDNDTLITEYTSHEGTIAHPDIAANKLTTFNTFGEIKMIQNKQEIADSLGIPKENLDTLEAQNGKAANLAGETIESKTKVSSEPEKAKEQPITRQEIIELTKTRDDAILLVIGDLTATIKVQTEQLAKMQTELENVKQPIDDQAAKIAADMSPLTLRDMYAKHLGLAGSVIGNEAALVDGRTSYGQDKAQLKDAPVNRFNGRTDIGLGEGY